MQTDLTAKGKLATECPVLFDPASVAHIEKWVDDGTMMKKEQELGNLYHQPNERARWRWRIYVDEEPPDAIRKRLQKVDSGEKLKLPKGMF